MNFGQFMTIILFLAIHSIAFSQAASPGKAVAPLETMPPDASMQWRGSGGWGPGCIYCRDFNLKDATTVTGTVEKIETMLPAKGMVRGIHMVVNTGKDVVSVHLGPKWYLENQDTSLARKDKVTVNGVKAQWEGKQVIIAFTVEKGGKTLTLRDEQGQPAWSAWREGHMKRGAM
jgi:hypothetical protein